MIVGMKRLGFVLYSSHAVHVCEFKKHSLVTSALCWQIIEEGLELLSSVQFF